MKLSEAMRLGSLMGPQIFLGFWDDNGGTCAMGAALLSVGIRDYAGLNENVSETFPLIAERGECPICGQLGPIGMVIQHLNDGHRCTREHIADWVATIESQETSSEQHQETQKELVGA